jgi:hypothetical protein
VGQLGAGDGGSRSWHSLLWHQWIAALRAEAAVLARDPAQPATSRTPKRRPIATHSRAPSPQRAEALLRARTRILARNGERATGEGEPVHMGATPMAAYW